MIVGNILGSEAVIDDHLPLFGFLVCRIGAFQSATLEYSELLRGHLVGQLVNTDYLTALGVDKTPA